MNDIKRTIWAILGVLAAIMVNAQSGNWTGSLDIAGTKLPLVFHFTSDGCTLDSPLQGAYGISAEMVVSGNRITVTVPSIGARFAGMLADEHISGEFEQGGASLPLVLSRQERPQTPVAPFPYIQEELSFDNGGMPLYGTLCVPEVCTASTPVVVMITGSGQQNRDEELFGHKPFAVIADALARRGIASFRYDDRGWGNADVKFSDFTITDFKHDAETSVKQLRKRFNKVGVIGHSEGGTIALMLAADGKVDFAVSLAGMTVTGKETLLRQNRLLLSASGISSIQLDSCLVGIGMILDQVAAGKGAADIDDYGLLSSRAKEIVVRQLMAPYMRELITTDVGRLLPDVRCPVLAINGRLDTQVDCEANLKVVRDNLADAKVVAYDGLNHLLQHCKSGTVDEYQQIDETIAPEVLSEIAEWINSLK